jgi:hypothetical protein
MTTYRATLVLVRYQSYLFNFIKAGTPVLRAALHSRKGKGAKDKEMKRSCLLLSADCLLGKEILVNSTGGPWPDGAEGGVGLVAQVVRALH